MAADDRRFPHDAAMSATLPGPEPSTADTASSLAEDCVWGDWRIVPMLTVAVGSPRVDPAGGGRR